MAEAIPAGSRTTEYLAFLASQGHARRLRRVRHRPGRVHPVLNRTSATRCCGRPAAAGGRFRGFGLGKTLQQLEIERLILAEHGGGRGLIVCPLGVRQEFARDAAVLGMETTFIRTAAEASRDGIYLTNYESVRDGKLDPRGSTWSRWMRRRCCAASAGPRRSAS